jgi:hypothetical protein
MQVFSMIWPSFYVLWLLRTLTSPPAPLLGGVGSRVKGGLRDAAIACLFLILATLVDWYHMLYLLIFTGLVLLWTLGRVLSEQRSRGVALRQAQKPEQGSRGAEEKVSSFSYPTSHIPHPTSHFTLHASRFTPLLRPILLVLAIGLGFSLVLSPLLIPMMRAARTTPELQTGLEQSITLSADLLAFILPSEMHPLWGEWTQTIAANFSSTLSERLVFAGFVPLALTLFIIIRGWQSRVVKFWTFITTSFFILALGPYLHIGGKIITLGDWPIPLPYLLLYHLVPFIRLTRSLSRYDLMVMLGLGVLVAIALAYLSARTADRRVRSLPVGPQTADQLPATRRKILNSLFTIHHSQFTIHYWLPLLATLLICFEFLPIPYPISKIDTPQFYFDLAAQPEDFTIAELPLNWDRPTPMLYQTVHGKRLLTAYTSRDNPLELAWRTPVLQHWRYLGPDIIDQPLPLIAPTIFYDFNLRYIVLDYWQMPPSPEREATERWVAAALPGATPIYDDGRLKVYQAPPKQETQPYLTLGDGWSKRQANETDFVTRTFSPAERPPELFLHHPQNRPLVLEVTATVAQGPAQNLTLLAFDQPVSIIQVTQIPLTQAINLPPFPDDLVKLSFHANNPTGLVSILSLSLKEE